MGKKKYDLKQKRKRINSGFFNFNKNKFTKLARDYHRELFYLTVDLYRTNRKLHESAALCHQQINFLKKKNTSHLVPHLEPPCFRDALYHVENFSFRVTGYRDKIVQFINQSLRLGFDEGAMGVLNAIRSNRIVKESHLDTELRRFEKNKDFKDVLSERILMTHRRYYKPELGYDALMKPATSKTGKELLKLWKQNIELKTNRANRIVLAVTSMNNRVMDKINVYNKKY
jgi:hypothetical protein